MKVAIPIVDGKLCMHFGHCQEFALIDIDESTKVIKSAQRIVPPPHEPGILPQWLHQQGADVIISGGMGMRAQQFFQQYGIKVVVGANVDDPEKVAQQWVDGLLITGENICYH
jgi:ATP-binding protein involved in chromosome partitioning